MLRVESVRANDPLANIPLNSFAHLDTELVGSFMEVSFLSGNNRNETVVVSKYVITNAGFERLKGRVQLIPVVNSGLPLV